eukprot:4732772-Amphidinium_carterae.1
MTYPNPSNNNRSCTANEELYLGIAENFNITCDNIHSNLEYKPTYQVTIQVNCLCRVSTDPKGWASQPYGFVTFECTFGLIVVIRNLTQRGSQLKPLQYTNPAPERAQQRRHNGRQMNA